MRRSHRSWYALSMSDERTVQLESVTLMATAKETRGWPWLSINTTQAAVEMKMVVRMAAVVVAPVKGTVAVTLAAAAAAVVQAQA